MHRKYPNSFFKEFSSNLYAKCEYLNPSHSIQDRTAFEMISQTLKEGKINQDSTIIIFIVGFGIGETINGAREILFRTWKNWHYSRNFKWS